MVECNEVNRRSSYVVTQQLTVTVAFKEQNGMS